MKVFFTLFAAVIVVSQAVSFVDLILEEWGTFKISYKKKYDNELEEKFRMKIFMDNRLMIAKHNAKYELGLVSYKLAINQFGDMLHHEFVNTMNGYNKSSTLSKSGPKQVRSATFITPANVKIPDTVDWTTQGAVTGVKDQGQCGSCWAFSATGALEGQHFRKTGVLVSVSEQNLIDCSRSYGNNGCEGGLMDYAFHYVEDNDGIDTEDSYPYEAKDDVCRFNPDNVGATDVGWTDISQGDEEALKAAVAAVGPISVAIDASHTSFQSYSEGVYYEPDCSTTQLDHGVLAVGYGTDENGQDYWLVKNSWGQSWGQGGYIKMARNRNNNCGIATSASYPLV